MLIKWLSSLFGFKKSVTSISKKSDKIFDVFTKTQKECDTLNAEIIKMTATKREEAQKILDEVKSLETVATKNENLSKKIQSFINN